MNSVYKRQECRVPHAAAVLVTCARDGSTRLLVLVSNGVQWFVARLNRTSGCEGKTVSTFAPDACSFDIPLAKRPTRNLPRKFMSRLVKRCLQHTSWSAKAHGFVLRRQYLAHRRAHRERCPRGCHCTHSCSGQPQPTSWKRSPGPLSSRTPPCRRLLLQRPSRAAACGQPPLQNRATTGAVPAMIINGPQCRTGAPTHAPIVRTLAAKSGAAPSTRPRTRRRRRRHQYRRRSRRRSRRRD